MEERKNPGDLFPTLYGQRPSQGNINVLFIYFFIFRKKNTNFIFLDQRKGIFKVGTFSILRREISLD